MPAPVPLAQLVILEQVVAKFPDGATVEQIAGAMVPPPAERTLSRWLAVLVQRRRVERIGHTRAIRYRALRPRAESAPVAATPAAPEASAAQRELRAPLSVSACPPTPGADITEQIFAAAIGDIVRFTMSRATAVMVLQRMTELNIASVDDRRACLALLKARLDGFTPEEADRYGLEPEQYQAWRAQEAVETSGRKAPPTAQNQAERPAADIRHPMLTEAGGRDGSARRVEDAPAIGGSSLPSGGRAKEGGPALPQAGDAEAVPGFQQAATDLKRLMTPKRVAVSALWAGGVSTAASHLIGGAGAQAVTFLAAGVPALLYVDHDRMAADKPMDNRSIATTLVAGSVGSMMCAAPVSYVLDTVWGLFR